jgi:hypothetical protein
MGQVILSRMPITAEPTNGFDWNQVTWTRPRDGRPGQCCYCNGPMSERRVIVIDPGGRGCEFCQDCVDRYWDKPSLAMGGERPASAADDTPP